MNRVSSVDELKALVAPLAVFEEYLKLSPKGKRRAALCPFHKEKTPSFSVDADTGLFYCFGCHKGGDVIKFIEEIERCSFEEAVSILARKAGVEYSRNRSDKDGREGQRRENLSRLMGAALKFYRESLLGAPRESAVWKYVRKRGISEETAEGLSLGYSGERGGLLSALLKAGFRKEDGVEAGILREGRQGEFFEYFRERLIFPIFDLQGRAVGFGGRTLGNDEPKYLNTPETPLFRKRELLYGLNLSKDEIRKEGKAVLVEGYMDFLSLHEGGVRNCAASLGTSLTPNQAALIKRYTGNVVLLYDFDNAGKAAMERALPVLLGQDLDIRIALIPEGKDPDESIRKLGPDEFRKRLETGMSFLDFVMHRFTTGKFLTLEEKLKFLESVAVNLAEIQDPLRREAYLDELSDRTGVKRSLITQKIEKMGKVRSGEGGGRTEEEPEIPVNEQILLKAAISANNDLMRKLSEMEPGLLGSLRTGNIIRKLMDGEEVTGEKELRVLAFVKNSCHEVKGVEDVSGAIFSIERESLERRRRETTSRLRDAQQKGDAQLVDIFTRELSAIVIEAKNIQNSKFGSKGER